MRKNGSLYKERSDREHQRRDRPLDGGGVIFVDLPSSPLPRSLIFSIFANTYKNRLTNENLQYYYP